MTASIESYDRTSSRKTDSRAMSYATVAGISLALGIAGTMLVLRFQERAPSLSQAASAPLESSHGQTGSEHSGGSHAEEASGRAVYVSPARQQLIGVRTAAIERRPLESSIRTVGTLAYDETRIAQVHPKIAGWVERVHVDYVGKLVRRDEPLLEIYSPELVSTQTEYLLALKARAELGASPVAATRSAAESLFAAARDRLRFWDVPEDEIETLERTREVRKTLTLRAPSVGIVLERNAFPGQYVAPETATFKIADLSRIWAFGAIFEYELPLVRVGQQAEIEFPYGATSRTLRGTITYIYPEIDVQTRRVKIRVELDNPGIELKPDSYVTFVIRVRGAERLVIPKEAVIDTGLIRYSILAHPDGYFEPREIDVGPPDDASYPVLHGLEEGDRVVVSAQFLIDSETNLQAAMQSMTGMHGMEPMELTAEGTPATETPPQHRH
ncbi:MAG TPA: efflux RND transporter periplasmic adaptor subunit [Vicinamibacteria bacterium]|nr:efflux RND transporter periplasmic adaptor subunit [Vicinamibacteria bacterium]